MSSGRPAEPKRLVVSIFCGGRGGARLIRELLRHPQVELFALINAYDDGLSTGELRDFIPGMLGPSDFRKNLANFLHWHSQRQFALTRLLDYRFSASGVDRDLAGLREWVRQEGGKDDSVLSDSLRPVMEMASEKRAAIQHYLRAFFSYQEVSGTAFRFEDCSLGNLIFAGAYLANDRNFNVAAEELARTFESQARLLNVSNGENRVLVAMKEDGEILENESRIVSEQSNERILDFFFLERPLSPTELEQLHRLKEIPERLGLLRTMHKPVSLSDEARAALLKSDIILYGPGTQFSSLLPSYKTQGIGEAVGESRARLKIFITNIHSDHDIQGTTAAELVQRALTLLEDPKNQHQTITHVLATRKSAESGKQFRPGDPSTLTPLLQWENGDFEHPARPGAHSGYMTVRRIFSLYEESATATTAELVIYVNLYRRSLALRQLLDEFLELPWQRYFKRVCLRIDHADLPELSLPPHLRIESVARTETFSEVHELSDWAVNQTAKYFASLSGDGEYRLSDLLSGMEIITQHPFAAVYGSRTQSRAQFFHSLNAAYGETGPLYFLSLAGGFLFSLLFVLRFGVIFSDPLTGFRLFNRSALADLLPQLAHVSDQSSSGITKLLMREGCEIAEIPVSYRTFKGFTNTRWRLWRSFRNAWRIFF